MAQATVRTLNPADYRLEKSRGGAPAVKTYGIVGAVLLGLGLVLGVTKGDHMRHFWFAYLTGVVFVTTIGLGGLFFTILQHLTKAGWSVSIRRMSEIMTSTLPFAGLLTLPIVAATWMGDSSLYPWVDEARRNPESAGFDHFVAHKAIYLDVTWFSIRYLVYFGIWGALGAFFVGRSKKQDESGDAALTSSMERLAPVAMIIFALTITFWAFDFIMGLDPHWFSTIFGVYLFGASMLANMCVLAIGAHALKRKGLVSDEITNEHFHDIGKLTFAFVFFWGYIAFSQFMLIWYANIPETTGFFKLRWKDGGWQAITIILLFGHLLIPFAGLLSRHIKRNPAVLVRWCWFLLLMHLVDMFWLIRPGLNNPHYSHGAHAPGESHVGYYSALEFSLIDITVIGGVIVAGVAWGLHLASRTNLLAARDPRIGECLAHHNI